MSSNGKEICEWLFNQFPSNRMDPATWEFWARTLAKDEWDTGEAKEALASHFRRAPCEFLPSLPIVSSIIQARAAQLARGRLSVAPECTRDDPTPEEATLVVKGIFDRAPKGRPFVKRPGWDASHFIAYNWWQRKANQEMTDDEVTGILSSMARNKQHATGKEIR
jgi:hypothetical protein